YPCGRLPQPLRKLQQPRRPFRNFSIRQHSQALPTPINEVSAVSPYIDARGNPSSRISQSIRMTPEQMSSATSRGLRSCWRKSIPYPIEPRQTLDIDIKTIHAAYCAARYSDELPPISVCVAPCVIEAACGHWPL